MISHKHKFIFIHVPKTAGTSVEHALHDDSCLLLPNQWNRERVPHTPLNHLTLAELVEYGACTRAQLTSYFKFCFVRNPWDRLISEIFCPWMHRYFGHLDVDKRIRYACEVAATPTGIGNHIRPQVDFIQADDLRMDFIGRFERLEDDFLHICGQLGLNLQLPHLNRSSHRSYPDYFDSETKALTTAAYQREIEYFKYRFGDES